MTYENINFLLIFLIVLATSLNISSSFDESLVVKNTILFGISYKNSSRSYSDIN
jgi:hypothetical protein